MKVRSQKEALLKQKQAYDKVFSEGTPYQTAVHEMLYTSIVKLVKRYSGKGKVLLDVGSGDGRLESEIYKDFKKIVGIDLSPVAIKKAKELIKKDRITNTIFKVSSIEDLPTTTKFDVILMANFIEHVYNLDIVFNKTALLLNPGGVVIILSRNKDALTWKISRVLKKDIAVESGTETPIHEYTFRDVKKALEKSNLNVDAREAAIIGPIEFSQSMPLLMKTIYKAGAVFPNSANYMIVSARKE